MQRIVSTAEMPSPLFAESTTVVLADKYSTPSAPPSCQGNSSGNQATCESASLARISSMVTTMILLITQTTIRRPSTTTAIKSTILTTKTTMSLSSNTTTQRLAPRPSAYQCHARAAVRRSAAHTSLSWALKLLPDQARPVHCGRSVGGLVPRAINVITPSINTCVMSNMTTELHFISICTTLRGAIQTCLLSIMTTS